LRIDFTTFDYLANRRIIIIIIIIIINVLIKVTLNEIRCRGTLQSQWSTLTDSTSLQAEESVNVTDESKSSWYSSWNGTARMLEIKCQHFVVDRPVAAAQSYRRRLVVVTTTQKCQVVRLLGTCGAHHSVPLRANSRT